MHTVQLMFPYNKGDESAYVVITARSMNVLTRLARNPKIAKMASNPDIKPDGLEVLIRAMLADQEGGFLRVERFKDNKDNKLEKHNDGPNGEPAKEVFDENGKVIREERFSDGDRNDGPTGEPAILDFDENGKATSFTHYKFGVVIPPPTLEEKALSDKAKADFVQKILGPKFTVRRG